MEKYYISVNENGIKKQVVKLTYTKDGWFFIQDRIRINQENKKCLIWKYKSDVLNNWERILTPHYYAMTSGDIKFTHHFDWNAHISWRWVISWYNEDGSPKGASIKSFNLNKTNDWGPMFSIMFWWNINVFRDTSLWDIILEPLIREKFEKLNWKYYGLILEFFYIPKSLIIWDNWIESDYINFYSSVEWWVKLRIIPSPKHHPWCIWVVCSYIKHGHISEVWFTMSWAPWTIYDERYCDVLSVIYPWSEPGELPYEKLDYIP